MPPAVAKLTILFLAANPAATTQSQLDEEVRAIDDALRKSEYRARFDLHSAWAVRYGDLQELLLRHKPHIVHFSGHGSEAGEILLQDGAGAAHPVPADALAALFAILKGNVRCVVLNACYSDQQARGIATSIDCVAGTPWAVADLAAVDFAAGLYLGLGYGRSVQEAFELGRNRIGLAGRAGVGTPQLTARAGVDPAQMVLVSPLAETDERRARELAYLDGLLKDYKDWAQRYTPLAGVATVAAKSDTPTLDLPDIFMPPGFEKLVEHGYGPEKRIERVQVDDLRDAVTQYKRLVVLGEPGSGKTTTLRRLVYDYAVAAQQDPAAPLPVFVPLGGYSGPETALDYAAQARYSGVLGPQLADYLRNGRVVLLLDAVNEMPRAGYKERLGRVQALLDEFKDAPVIVTCRALDYVEELKLEKLEVKPLDPPRQREFLRRYLGESRGEKLFWELAGRKVADLWGVWQRAGATIDQFFTAGEIPSDVYRLTTSAQHDELWRALRKGGLPPLLALGVNPFLLVMFAQVYASKGALPQNRGSLFAAFVDTLLERERKRRAAESWPGSELLANALGELAYAMQWAGERGTAVRREWAQVQLRDAGCSADEAFYLCASASLLTLTDHQVSFVHQLVQEYLAALAWRQRFAAGDDLRRYWPKRWVKPTGWEETALLLAGILPDMTEFIGALTKVHPGLAARCIAESGGVKPNDATINAVQQTLVGVATNRKAKLQERNATGNALNWVGDPREGVGVKDGLPDIVWCKVPAGEFVMGESPSFPVTLPAFVIGKYPVTNIQYQVFIDDGGCTEKCQRCWTRVGWEWRVRNNRTGPDRYGGAFDLPNHPVVGVTWYEAVAYCHWLSDKLSERLGRTVTVRLPREAEWEKAARGTDGRRYPWGKDITPKHANYSQTGIVATSAVGVFPRGASPYGLLDASGNVWEWTGSLYQPYPYKPKDGREEFGAFGTRTLRGGSWRSYELWVRCAYRVGLDPDDRNDRGGFRLVSPIH